MEKISVIKWRKLWSEMEKIMVQSGENYGAEMEKNVVKQGEAPWRAPRRRLVTGTSSGMVLGVLGGAVGRFRCATTGWRLLTGTEQARQTCAP